MILSNTLLFSSICLEQWAGKTHTSSAYHALASPTYCSLFFLGLDVLRDLTGDLGFSPLFLLNKILKPSYLSAHILPNKFTHTFKIRKRK